MRDWLKDPGNLQPHLPAAIKLGSLLSARGGQGVVHRGTVNGKDAAVKVYLPGQVLQRIEREVRALGRLSCPSIVRLLWHGSIDVQGQQLPVVATQLVSGDSLSDVLASGAFDGGGLGKIGYDVATAIQGLWAARIVHRDVKPDNILVTPDGRACVIDLGIARHVDETSITATGLAWGTLGYMSPEQTRARRRLTCKSDVFALGVVLVEAAEGVHPTGRDQMRLLARGLHRALPALAGSWKHANTLMRMLEPRPARRPLPSAILAALVEYAT